MYVHIHCTMYMYTPFQMYVMLDALADGGVYAGIPKEIGLRLIAHTMIVGTHCMYACNIYIYICMHEHIHVHMNVCIYIHMYMFVLLIIQVHTHTGYTNSVM